MNLTLTLAAEWGRLGVRVNGLVIGNYPHAGIPGYDPDKAGPRAISIPARRPLRAQEIGRAAAFLCSPYARHITGTNLVIDGGDWRSEEHTSELQSLMRISYAVFCLKTKKSTQHIQFSGAFLHTCNSYEESSV